MGLRGKTLLAVLGGSSLLAGVLALPVIAQRGPASLLPPGFSEIEEDAPQADSQDSQDSTPNPRADQPSSPNPIDDIVARLPEADDGAELQDLAINGVELSPEELAAQQAKFDLPNEAKRSLALIGPLTDRTGGVSVGAFGDQSGQYLATLMRQARAPFVSRWASILLRRVLLSATTTPADINGADWAAERAWLLVRMGEADAARMMVQSVDTDNYTPRLDAVAMQAYLVTADMAGLCPISARAASHAKRPGWKMSNAICESFSGNQGSASAILNQALHNGSVKGIDYYLTEKMVGAGVNSRRSVKIEWDKVDRLTAWRFGLATGTNVDIPAKLLESGGARVLAWQARAPMLSLATKFKAVQTAARLGVFSNSALVDYYAALAAQPEPPANFVSLSQSLSNAYSGRTVEDRVAAIKAMAMNGNALDYVGLLGSARAAARLPEADIPADDAALLVAAMLSGGYDIPASRWSGAVGGVSDANGLGWALLAVGVPQLSGAVSTGDVSSFAGSNELRGKMLLAGLAGLGRLPKDAAFRSAEDLGMNLAARTKWTDALARAAQQRQKGTVALLSAIGMQTGYWSKMPPEHLYHIIAALRAVGLEPEARMIAAEAIMRT